MRKFIVSMLLLSASFISYSQSFMHGAGIGIFVADNPARSAAIAGTFSYSPRFNFLETGGFSLSVGVPINVGVSGSYSMNYDSYYGSSESNTLGFMINAPLMLNLNVGAGSSQDAESKFGFFVGGGLGMHYGDVGRLQSDGYGDDYYDTHYQAVFGPAGNVGFRIGVGRQQKNIEFRLSYMKSVANGAKTSVYGFNTLFNF